MTNEEAIKTIEVVFKNKEAYKHNDSVTHQALNMAIEALSSDAIAKAYNQGFVEGSVNATVNSNYVCPRCGEKMERKEGSDTEIVRCKDCRHRVYDEERNFYYCEIYYGQGDVSDENFCQWGERRTVEELKTDRPQGEWLYRWNDVECSECGEFEKKKSNYCPNCGARMKGGDDD